jgi:hypothetical protein
MHRFGKSSSNVERAEENTQHSGESHQHLIKTRQWHKFETIAKLLKFQQLKHIASHFFFRSVFKRKTAPEKEEEKERRNRPQAWSSEPHSSFALQELSICQDRIRENRLKSVTVGQNPKSVGLSNIRQ